MFPDTDFDQSEIRQIYTILRYNTRGFFGTVLAWGFVFGILLSLIASLVFNQDLPDYLSKQVAVVGMAGALSIWLSLRGRVVVYDNGLESGGAFDDLSGNSRPHFGSPRENLSHFEG